jgi:hypothetical protein
MLIKLVCLVVVGFVMWGAAWDGQNKGIYAKKLKDLSVDDLWLVALFVSASAAFLVLFLSLFW